MPHRKLITILLAGVLTAPASFAGVFERGQQLMMCHRMANRDVPENTLESLAAAARLGCDIVELDIIETRDGVLGLLHDGPIDRLSDGSGNVNDMLWDELRLYDMGSWMGERFAGLQMPLFVDALRQARDTGLALHLDIKTEGAGLRILDVVRQEGMIERVRFGGLWDDVKQHYPGANEEQIVLWTPEMTAAQVDALQRQGKFVVASFSANGREMDLDLMKRAAAAQVDAINTDYPRLAADALGRPVEAKVRTLLDIARNGRALERTRAVLAAAKYRDFPLEVFLTGLLGDPDSDVARAAAVALVQRRRVEAQPLLLQALTDSLPRARANAAWALGFFSDDNASAISNLLSEEKDVEVLREALFALSRLRTVPDGVSLDKFLPHQDAIVTGAAALAITRSSAPNAPALIARAREALRQRIAEESNAIAGKPTGQRTSPEEIRRVVAVYQGYVKLAQALDALPQKQLLFEEALRPSSDMTQSGGLTAGFRLWDRVAENPAPAIAGLASEQALVAERAEWALVKAGPNAGAAVREALPKLNGLAAQRAIRILAWRGDHLALPQLRTLAAGGELQTEAQWAIAKIETLSPLYESR